MSTSLDDPPQSPPPSYYPSNITGARPAQRLSVQQIVDHAAASNLRPIDPPQYPPRQQPTASAQLHPEQQHVAHMDEFLDEEDDKRRWGSVVHNGNFFSMCGCIFGGIGTCLLCCVGCC
ncbi:hypothetical protein FRB95_007054 [Tulasnella sp. JGI-2019a]|nr:hypothetical protein FRB95_007054 [Tulasnella sp. JGI-2019a]